MVEAVSRVWRMYLLSCKCLSVVTNHATLVHPFNQACDRLQDTTTHWAEKLKMYENSSRILYKKGILNEADPASRRPDFLPVDNLYNIDESLWWDINAPKFIYNLNDLALFALSTLEALINDDDYFLSNLKGAYSS